MPRSDRPTGATAGGSCALHLGNLLVMPVLACSVLVPAASASRRGTCPLGGSSRLEWRLLPLPKQGTNVRVAFRWRKADEVAPHDVAADRESRPPHFPIPLIDP